MIFYVSISYAKNGKNALFKKISKSFYNFFLLIKSFN
jgi:hypothetical protein